MREGVKEGMRGWEGGSLGSNEQTLSRNYNN